MPDKAHLRVSIKQQRAQLDAAQQHSASQSALQTLKAQPVFQSAQHMAFYQAHGGELDPQPILLAAQQAGKQCYLPIVKADGSNQLQFAPVNTDTRFQTNRYGILEPEVTPAQLVSADTLDLVLVPLVAVDTKGNRLGMGKGYYDRTFAFRKAGSSQPQLVGLAHNFQVVDQLDVESWDVPLDAVVTGDGMLNFGI